MNVPIDSSPPRMRATCRRFALVLAAGFTVVASGCGGGSSSTNSAGNTAATTGSVTVTISPAGAVAAGAKWTLDGDSGHQSGVTLSGVTAGAHTIAFTTVSGYSAPASQSVTVTAGQTATASGTYTANSTGDLSGTVARVRP